MQQVIEFRKLMLLLFHITGGQPARGREIVTIRVCNSMRGQTRNIFIEDGMVVFVTQYHKGFSHKGSIKIIHRYLPRTVGALYVYYEWLVRPFQTLIEAEVWDQYEISPFMWPADPQGKKWDTPRMTQAMFQSSRAAMGVEMGSQGWRDICIAISRRYLRTDHQFGEDADDEDGELDEDNPNTIYDKQAAHAPITAGRIYSRMSTDPDGVVASTRELFRNASIEWHTFLGFPNPTDSIDRRRKRSTFDDEVRDVSKSRQ